MRIDAGASAFLDSVFGTDRPEQKSQAKINTNDIKELSDKLGLSKKDTKQFIKVLLGADVNVGASFKFDREDGGTVTLNIGADINIKIDSPLGSASLTLANIDGVIDINLNDDSEGRLGLSVDFLANVSSSLLKGISLALKGALDIARGKIDFSLGGKFNFDNPIFNRFPQG